MTPGRRQHRRNRSRGQSLVEFALVFPLFMLILLGILDFGFMLYSRMTVINAAREGARAAITAKDPTTIPALASGAVTGSLVGINPGSVTVSTACVALVSASCDFVAGGGTPDPQAGDAVRVQVTYVYHSFFPLLFGNTFNLTSSVQMVLEG